MLCICPACSFHFEVRTPYEHFVSCKAYTLEAVWFVGTCLETACFLGRTTSTRAKRTADLAANSEISKSDESTPAK